MDEELSHAFNAAEEVLREVIFIVWKEKKEDWNKVGVTDDMLKNWKKMYSKESAKAIGNISSPRLLAYAVLGELISIILENRWSCYRLILGDKQEVKYLLGTLKDLRNPRIHGRSNLYTYQRYLAIGISGELQNRIASYRAKGEVIEDYYPRILSITISNGFKWDSSQGSAYVTAGTVRWEDAISFLVFAVDPYNDQLEYGWRWGSHGEYEWQNDGEIRLEINDGESYSSNLSIEIVIRSPRKPHRDGECDHSVQLCYKVLPERDIFLKKNKGLCCY